MANLLAPTPDAWSDLLVGCSFDHGGRVIAIAPVVIRRRPRPAPQPRQISIRERKRGRIENAPFFFICLLSLSAKRRHCGRFLGRLEPAAYRGPDEAQVSGQVQRYATTQPLSDQEGKRCPGDYSLLWAQAQAHGRTATKSQRHLASVVCAEEGRCSFCWRH